MECFKVNEIGNIAYWKVIPNEKSITTKWGIIDGKEQISEYPVYETNIGRANYRNFGEQAVFESQALFKKKLNEGYYRTIEEAKQAALSPKVVSNGGVKPMKCYKYGEKPAEFPCYVQPKLNGMRCTHNGDKLYTSTGKEINTMQHIVEQVKNIPYQLDGELYQHGRPLQEIVGLVRAGENPDPERIELEYHVFDIIDFKLPFDKRLEVLYNLNINLVETILVNSEQEADEQYKKWVSEGYEGMIYRKINSMYLQKRSKDMLKRKDFLDSEFNIVGFTEGKGKMNGMLASFICISNGKEFDAPMNGTHKYLKKLWDTKEDYIGKNLTVRYLELTKDGVPSIPKGIEIRDYE
jgi:ATP-dependent DNA ligase